MFWEDIAVLSEGERPRFGPADVITNHPLYMTNTSIEKLSVILMGCKKTVVGRWTTSFGFWTCS